MHILAVSALGVGMSSFGIEWVQPANPENYWESFQEKVESPEEVFVCLSAECHFEIG